MRMPIESIPREVVSVRTETSVDNGPNRFVRFALTRWRDVLVVIKDALKASSGGFAVTRGLDEITVVLEHIQGLLSEELFREVGPLTAFPAGNQVLQRREGYRDVLRAYLQFELAAKLAWKGGEDVYRAGQRDVAALYEYWTFMQLAQVVADICEGTFDLADLIEVDQYGLGLRLRRGRTTIVKGVTSRFGRRLSLELWFNREFSGRPESWSLRMRPDCSLEIRPIEGDQGGTFDPVWLHFDAKYRITFVDVDAMNLVTGEEPSGDRVGRAKREDLLKMHAYRDAIRRSAGAYVLYPGVCNNVDPFQEYHELLPGLGAFALRPVDSGAPIGTSALTKFLNDVLDHVATQITQHERGRFWVKTVYDEQAKVPKTVLWAPFLPRPPADTWVAIGHVRDPLVLAWIEQHLLFPVCVDDTGGPIPDPRLLTADVILLHGPGVPKSRLFLARPESELYGATRLKAAGYPEVRGQFYYCLKLEEVDLGQWQGHLTDRVVVEAIKRTYPGRPPDSLATLTWLDLILHVT